MEETREILFVVNPISGTSRKRTIVNQIERTIDKTLFRYRIVNTEYAGHARVIAREAANKGVDIVCAIGGDGTVNEVASALVHSDTALAIIPSGSGNGLARHLRIPRDAIRAIKLINRASPVAIDYGLINEHPFFCTCGVGLDAFISQKFAESGKRGFVSYLDKVLKHALTYDPETYELDVENEEASHVSYKATIIACANASQYGNNVYIAPGASVMDGLLDVIIVEPYNVLEATQMGVQIMNGTFDKNSHVKRFACKSLKIKRKSKGPVHFDGDPLTTGENIDVSIVKGGLKVICSGKEGARNISASFQDSLSMFYNNLYMNTEQLIEDGASRGKKLLGMNEQ